MFINPKKSRKKQKILPKECKCVPLCLCVQDIIKKDKNEEKDEKPDKRMERQEEM